VIIIAGSTLIDVEKAVEVMIVKDETTNAYKLRLDFGNVEITLDLPNVTDQDVNKVLSWIARYKNSDVIYTVDQLLKDAGVGGQ